MGCTHPKDFSISIGQEFIFSQSYKSRALVSTAKIQRECRRGMPLSERAWRGNGVSGKREKVVSIDPRRGPIPTVAPEEESGVDTRDLESDKKQSEETEVKKRGAGPQSSK